MRLSRQRTASLGVGFTAGLALAVALLFLSRATPRSNALAGPAATVTVTVSASPATAGVNQRVTIPYSATAATPGDLALIKNMQIDYGDGLSPDPLTPPSGTSGHNYGKTGTFTITVTALGASFQELGRGTAKVTITDPAPAASPTPAPAASPTAVPAAGPSITYQTGWNLVGAPAGTVFTQATNPLYTFPAGATAYVVVPNSQGAVAGQGYWAYFSQPTTVALSGSSSNSASVSAPAGQYVMIGNPSATQTLTVRGADVVYIFNTVSNGYATATTLAPGQGAWVLSNAGGTITVGP